MDLKKLLTTIKQRPVAYYPIYREVTGSTTAGILLSQVVYWWSKMGRVAFYKKDSELIKETGLGEEEFRNAKKILKTLPFVKIKLVGIPARTSYDIDAERLEYGMLNTPVKIGLKRTNQFGLKTPTTSVQKTEHITEITTEITTENSSPAVEEPPHSEQPQPLKEKKKKKEEVGRAGAENEPKELATVFDLARKELLEVSGMDWGQAKEHSNLKKLVAALGRRVPPKEGEYDLPKKKQYLQRFLKIASEDKFVRENFTPSILYSMMNKIFTTYELKKREAESKPKIEEMPYHKKFNHEPSGIAMQLAAKKSA